MLSYSLRDLSQSVGRDPVDIPLAEGYVDQQEEDRNDAEERRQRRQKRKAEKAAKRRLEMGSEADRISRFGGQGREVDIDED